MQPKKSLGQNFLRDEKILEKIIEVADLKSDDNVLEIGPGEGVLTEKLLRATNHLICVEKNEHLAEKIARKFQMTNFQFPINDKIQNYKFEKEKILITGDILEINLPEIIRNNFSVQNLTPNPSPYKGEGGNYRYKLISNIPYYITSPIIQLFLETEFPPSEMILMVQREVAERICARPGQMSILAVSVQYYAKAELLFEVSRKSFWPVPEVDSAMIRISKINNQRTMNNKENTKHFFKIVKAGFCAKRKTLLNNLSSSLQIDKKEMEEILQKVGIKPNQRAQELSVEDWKKLANLLKY